MSMSRRGFLGAMLGAMSAPAIVRAESLMKIVVPKREIINPLNFGTMAYYPEDSFLTEAYNRAVARTDMIGEIFWPTIVIDPKMVGLQVACNYELDRSGILVGKREVIQ